MTSVELYATGIGTAVAIIGAVGFMARDCGNKVNRMYKRFDEHKDSVYKTHVSKEVHVIQYEQLKDSMDEIKCDVKQLLKNQKNGKA